MSAVAWFEEVDKGLIEEIKKSIKIKDQQGTLVSLEDNAVIIRKPEEEFKLEVFPCVSIYNLGYQHDKYRYNKEPIRLGHSDGMLKMKDSTVPFNLEYQIDFWSRYNTDMNSMTSSWLRKHFRQFNLDVSDENSKGISCNCLSIGSVVKSDLILNGERLYHSILKYSIWVELDSETSYNEPMVTRVSIDQNRL